MRKFILKYLLKDKDFILAEDMRKTANRYNVVSNKEIEEEKEVILAKIRNAAEMGLYEVTFNHEIYADNRIKLITAGYEVTTMMFGTLIEW